jgi:hypothetical protein
MATTTTNFGWDIPQSTDLVKDGATAIAALGQDIDTAFIDLKGGTTGQVLAKASGTDLDFSWVAQDDSNAIQNAIVDAKGDLIAATAADTPARLAVGTNGYVLTADSAEATGLKWAASAAGGMTLLSTTTLSGATTTISSISPTGYNSLYLEISGITCSANNDPYFQINGVTTTTYQNFTDGMHGSSTSAETRGNRTGVVLIVTGIVALKSSGGNNIYGVTITNPNSTTNKNIFLTASYEGDVGGFCTYLANINAIDVTSAISSIAFKTSSGTFSGGTVKIYGVK